ncbi:MAG: HEAT repeat domain-containing protein [Elusimicrobia bacterium]|nr:HEAT repeat domain-containing protein [Elusimicrobiota bacterium]
MNRATVFLACWICASALTQTVSAEAETGKTPAAVVAKACADLHSTSDDKRMAAMLTLGKELAWVLDTSPVMNKCLAEVKPGAVSRIIEAAARDDLNQDKGPGLLMAWVANPAAARLMIRVLGSDPEPRMRKQAALSLGRMKSPAGLDPLIKAALGDENRFVRNCAVISLGKLGSKKALQALERLSEDKDPTLRGLAKGSITSINAANVP